MRLTQAGVFSDPMLGYAMPAGWLARLTLARKFAFSFGLILLLLIGSVSALLFYLSRTNSYIDRHQRITVPALITAIDMLRNVSHIQNDVHYLLEHRSLEEQAGRVIKLADIEQETTSIFMTYRRNHAARTHPVLFAMLTQHGRVDLVDEEDEAMAVIESELNNLIQHRQHIQNLLSRDQEFLDKAESRYEQTATIIETAIARLVEVNRRIDVEMKIEGDRLVSQARFIALGLVCLLGLLIIAVFVLMRRQVADPLRRLATTADRVAHHDLGAQFESWPSRDEVGALAGSLTTMLASLREHSTSLVRKTKELEAFTYSIAHDLKGPLREIEGFSSLLEKQFADKSDPQVHHHISVIRQCALRLTHMIDALLKYSRLEQQELPKQRFNVQEMVDSLVSDRLSSVQNSKPTIRIELPFSELYGEPVSIRQALANLLDNAIKFSRQQIRPHIQIGGNDTPTERTISIQDNGIGFDQTKSEQVFGLFERLHGPNDYEGTGVGLAIVKLVMEKHQGRAWAESEVDKGSTFFLAFPKQVP